MAYTLTVVCGYEVKFIKFLACKKKVMAKCDYSSIWIIYIGKP